VKQMTKEKGHRRQFEDVYELGCLLGSGSFGSVMKAQRKDDPTMFVAVKQMTKEKGIKMDLLHNEIMIWEQLKHPNLVQLIDVFETDTELFLVTEIMRGGDLFQQLTKVEHFSEAEAVVLSRQIVSATAYLHEHGVVHCDLKPSNILLKAPLVKNETPIVKLADFGLSQLFVQATPLTEDDADGDSLEARPEGSGRKYHHKLTEVCGTPDYFSPELVELAQHDGELELSESQGYSSPLDCWAVGCIIYELLSGSPPYQAKEEQVLFYKITENNMDFPKETFGSVSPEAKELILQLTKTDPAERISCSAALEHPWLALEKSSPNPLPQQTVAQNRKMSTFRREERKSRDISALLAAHMPLEAPEAPKPAEALVEASEASESLPAAEA